MASTAELLEKIKQKKQAIQQASGRRVKTLKPTPGKSRWRILPSWRGDGQQFWHDFGQHFIKNTAGELQAVYVCLSKTYGDDRPCEVCNSLSSAIKACDDDTVIEKLKEASSKGRILLNALHLDGEDPKTPGILELTPTTFEKFLDLFAEYEDLMDLDAGRDIIITRTGSGLNTEYSIMVGAKTVKVDRAILPKLHNLDEYVAQEYEEGKKKALAAIGNVSGRLSAAGGAGLLTGPKGGSRPTPKDEDLDDDIPFDESSPIGGEVIEGKATEVKEPAPTPPKAASETTPAPSAPKKPDPKLAVEEVPAADIAGSYSDAEIDALLGDLD